MFAGKQVRVENPSPTVKANRLQNDLNRLDVVESTEIGRRDNVVEFDLDRDAFGTIPPELSRVLADNDASLFDGCLTDGYHEFKARVPTVGD